MWALVGVAFAISTTAGCQDSNTNPLTRRISHSPSEVIIAIQTNTQPPAAGAAFRIGNSWHTVSLPARRFVPYCSATRRDNTLLLGRMDGLICYVRDVVDNPAVLESKIRVNGPIMYMQIMQDDWIIVGRNEIIFGRISSSSSELKEVGRRRVEGLFQSDSKTQLTHSAYNETSNTLLLCFSSGAVVAVKDLLVSDQQTELISKVEMLGDIAAIGTIDATTYLLTVEGSSYSCRPKRLGELEFHLQWEKTAHCSQRSFLLSNKSWAVETNMGSFKEINILEDGERRLLTEGDDIRLLGDGGDDSGTVFVALDKGAYLQRVESSNGRVLESIDLKEIESAP